MPSSSGSPLQRYTSPAATVRRLRTYYFADTHPILVYPFSKHSLSWRPYDGRFSSAPPFADHHWSLPRPKAFIKISFPRKKVRSSLHLYTCNFYATTAIYEPGKPRVLSQQFDEGERRPHIHTETVAQPCRFCGKPTTNKYAKIPICPECARTKRLN